jgi:methyltransferase (TIGR00027 family)
MTKKAAETGSGPATVVAIEQNFPEGTRLIDDGLAGRLLPLGARFWAWVTRPSWMRDWMLGISEKKTPGVWAIFPCRKRYIEEKVADAVVEQAETVVNLGAGFDTLAYRLPALAKVPVWEVDQPENIDAKRSRLEKVLREVPKHVTLVSIDFDSDDLAAVLASHGYALDKKTFFILEAVTQYLTEAGIQTTFDFLAKAPAGSRLVFTYVRKDFIDGTVLHGLGSLHERLVLKDKSWLFGMDPEGVPDFLDGYGWRVLEHLGSEELAERYVKPTGRKLKSVPIEPVVYAEKT